MERAAFGYRDPEARDLLGEKIFEYRDVINQVAEKHYDVKVSAGFGGLTFHLGGGLLRIRLEGELNSLESTINEFFEKFGLPDVVDTPYGFIDKFFNSIPPATRSEELTTKPAYVFIKRIFKMKNVKSEELAGHVRVRI